MSNLSLTLSSDRLTEAIQRAPVALVREVGISIGRIILRIARDARMLAAKGPTSILTNSITSSKPSELEGIVAPGVNYARAVEEGTKPGYFPNLQNILDWVHGMKLQPQVAGDSERDIAWRIAKSIAQRGTPPQPYMAPALERNLAFAERDLSAAIDRALGVAS